MAFQTLWIISELFPPDETSTAYILGEIAKTMSCKYDVKVICGPEIYDKNKKRGEKELSLHEQIKIIRSKDIELNKNTITGKVLRFIFVSFMLYRIAKKNIKKKDKVLIVTNPAPLVLLISRLKKKDNFHLTILVHDVFPENIIPAGLNIPFIIYRYLKRLFDKAYSRADQLIVLGQDMKEVVKDKICKYNQYPKLRVIQNWADIDIVKPLELPRLSEKIVLGYAGNLGRVQGLQMIIDLFRIISNNSLLFHIWGTGAEENSLKEYVTHQKISDIVFHGAYTRYEQAKILSSCDLALVTLTDGMYGLGVPSKTYNVMAAGKPILYIGRKNSEIGILVREKKIGFVFEPNDRNGIMAFLSSLSPNNLLNLKIMGLRAREVAEKEYAKSIKLKEYLVAL